MAEAELIVVWGGNPVYTQVTAMAHSPRARKARGAKLVVIDAYRSPTTEVADLALIVRPGTDAALALAVMHVLLRDGLADRAYLAELTDFDAGVQAHLAEWTPMRAAAVTGVPVEQIEAFAALYGATKRSFLRPGFGFTRGRGGAAAMHAVACLPAMTGAWRERGGGAFFNNYSIWKFNEALIEGQDVIDPGIQAADLYRRRGLRQGRALRRAHPSSRPADVSARAASGRRVRVSLRASPGTRRWTRSRRGSMPPNASSAPNRSGPIIMPAPWAW